MTNQNISRYKKLVAVTLASSLYASTALAAHDGVLGPTSTGDLDITVVKTAQARISSLSDITVSNWSVGDGDVTRSENVCVYSSRSSGKYSLKATGSGTGGAFALASPAAGSTPLPYSLAWNDGGVGNLTGSGSTLSAGTTVSQLSNASHDSSDCLGGNNPGMNAKLSMTITAANMTAATDGTYTGTVTLLVAPD